MRIDAREAVGYDGDDAIRAVPFDAVALTMRRWWLETSG